MTSSKTRTGDGHWMNRRYVKRDEEGAIREATKKTIMENAALALWDEFKTGKTLAALDCQRC